MYIINKVKGILNWIAVNKCYNIYISYSSGLLDLSHLLPSSHAEVRRGKEVGKYGQAENAKVLTVSTKRALHFCLLASEIKLAKGDTLRGSSFQRATASFGCFIAVFPPFL